MATSGTISKKIGTNSVYTFWIDWVRNSQNVAANTSNITVTLKAKRNDGYPSYGAYNLNANNTIQLAVGGSVKVNNTAAKIDLRTSTGTTLATWTGDVGHNADGTLNLALEGYFYFNSSAASSLPNGGYTVSGTASIDTIPRKSSVACTDANVGSAAIVAINRASSTFTHTLTYAFGNLSGTIATKTSSTSIGWTLPTSFYAQMTKRTLQGAITCETFNGSTSLGITTCTFTATAVDTVTVTGTVVDTNSVTVELTGDASKLIRYFSTAKATIAASTNNSATITSKTINGVAVSADRTFINCEINKFTFYAKDSRDYSDSDTVELTMIPYVKLTVNAAVKRDTPTGNAITLTVKGNYYNGSFGATANTLGINYRFREAGTTSWTEEGLTPTINGNTYTASVNLTGFDYRTEYEFEISVADRLSGDVAVVDVVRGQPVFDWGKNDFNFNVPVSAPSVEIAGKATSKSVQVKGDSTGGVLFPSPLDANRYWWFFNYIVNGTDYSKMAFRSVNKIGDNSYYRDYVLTGLEPDDAVYQSCLILTEKNTADYIVDKGSSGIWTYEKYNSGLVYLHGKLSKTVNINSAWGNIFISSGQYFDATFPFTLTQAISESISCEAVGWSAGLVNNGITQLSTTTATSVQCWRGTAGASVPVTVYWEVVGKWK